MAESRDKWGVIVRAIAAGVLIVFVVGALIWFIVTVGDGEDVDAGNAFIGFGYFAGIVLVALLAMLGWRLLELMRNGEWQRRRPRAPGDEHGIIRVQMAWGSLLVIVGAVVGLLCLCIIGMGEDESGPVLALATAVISAGAVLLPAGAAGSASARLQQQLAESRLPLLENVTAKRTSSTEAEISGLVMPNSNEVTVYVEFEEIVDGMAQQRAREQTSEHVPASVPSKPVTLKATVAADKEYRIHLVAETAGGASTSSEWLPLKPAGGGEEADVSGDGDDQPPAKDQDEAKDDLVVDWEGETPVDEEPKA